MLGAGEKGALATIIDTRGSTPRKAGARMLVKSSGETLGTISGGCPEAEVWQAAKEVIGDGRPRILKFVMTEQSQSPDGLLCGGTARILVEPISAELAGLAAVFSAAVDLRERGQHGVMATVFAQGDHPTPRGGQKILLAEDGSWHGERPDGIDNTWLEKVMHEGLELQAPKQSSAMVHLLLEPVMPEPTLILFGAGHISIHLAAMAHRVGFGIVVVDDRIVYANSERYPMARAIHNLPVEEAFPRLSISRNSYVVIVTRNHSLDQRVLELAAPTAAGYVGMMASEAKTRQIMKELKRRGVAEQALERVHSPIGLPIQAETPEEIAVSILAEMIRVSREKTGVKRRRRRGLAGIRQGS